MGNHNSRATKGPQEHPIHHEEDQVQIQHEEVEPKHGPVEAEPAEENVTVYDNNDFVDYLDNVIEERIEHQEQKTNYIIEEGMNIVYKRCNTELLQCFDEVLMKLKQMEEQIQKDKINFDNDIRMIVECMTNSIQEHEKKLHIPKKKFFKCFHG
jgi:hypothetical protein